MSGGDVGDGQNFVFFSGTTSEHGFASSGYVTFASAGTINLKCGGDGVAKVNNLYISAIQTQSTVVTYSSN